MPCASSRNPVDSQVRRTKPQGSTTNDLIILVIPNLTSPRVKMDSGNPAVQAVDLDEIPITHEKPFTRWCQMNFGRLSLTREDRRRARKCRVGKSAEPPEQPIVADFFDFVEKECSHGRRDHAHRRWSEISYFFEQASFESIETGTDFRVPPEEPLHGGSKIRERARARWVMNTMRTSGRDARHLAPRQFEIRKSLAVDRTGCRPVP